MRRFILCALLAVVAGPLALAQQPPDPFLAERLLDPGALLFVSLPRSAAASEDYAKSNLRAMADHPEIRAFLEPFEAWFRKRRTQPTPANEPPWNEVARHMTGLTLDEMGDLLQGPVAFAAYDIPVSPDRKLDLVLTLGNPDAGALEKAAERVKEAIRRQGGAAEGKFQRGGATIYEIGSQTFRLFYTCIQGTLVFATRQERVEKILDAASQAAFAGLGADPAFKAARDRVTPENRHFAFFHLDLARILKQYRREVGDPALKIMESAGLADIRSVVGAMSYDGPHLRERYALLTSRQDRGILKLLAGGGTKDPHAALIPAGAISYAHFGLNLAEVFDIIVEAGKNDPSFEQDLKRMVEDVEGRLGVRVREALASVGSGWTAVSWMPEGGGVMPDGLYLISLNDPAKFEEAVEKVAREAAIAIEEMTFHGQKIRYLSLSVDDFDLASELGVPLRFGLSLSYFHKDGTLYLGQSPMSLKRQILRLERPVPPIAQDPKWAALAARVPESERESWVYADTGRTLAIVYNTFEPFIHLVRDFARDPQTGEPVVDLARMPLGETLGDLVGATLTTKRTMADGLLIESRSNTGLSFSSLGFTMMSLASITPLVIMGFEGGRDGGGTAQAEKNAEYNLKFIREAQETFKNSDSDRNGQPDYWTRDVAGLHALKDRSGQALGFVDRETAQADPDGAPRYWLPVAARNGYFFRALVTDPDGEAYSKDEDKDGQSTTNRARYGVVAWPAQYGLSGRFTFITCESGRTWRKDLEGQPVDRWPGKDPAEEGWEPAE